MNINPTTIVMISDEKKTSTTWQAKQSVEGMVYNLVEKVIPTIEQITGEITGVAIDEDFLSHRIDLTHVKSAKHPSLVRLINFNNDKYIGGFLIFLQETDCAVKQPKSLWRKILNFIK